MFEIEGEGPTGWKITNAHDGRIPYITTYVIGSFENALWVRDALNARIRSELAVVERGG